MRTFTLSSVALITAITLTGCASTDAGPGALGEVTPVPAATSSEPRQVKEAAEPPEVASSEAEPSETEAAASKTNERGNLVKDVGELAGVRSETGEPMVQFKVTDIESDFECTNEFADAPTNGTFLAVTLDVTTTAALAQDEFAPYLDVNAHDFKVISPEGTTENDSVGNGYSCLAESEQIPSQIGPGEHVTGKVVLDTANEKGSVVFSPFIIQPGGWEWGY